jgi:hypothetical protein
MTVVKITEEQARDIRLSDDPPAVICARWPHLVEEDVVKVRALRKDQLHPSWRLDR